LLGGIETATETDNQWKRRQVKVNTRDTPGVELMIKIEISLPYPAVTRGLGQDGRVGAALCAEGHLGNEVANAPIVECFPAAQIAQTRAEGRPSFRHRETCGEENIQTRTSLYEREFWDFISDKKYGNNHFSWIPYRQKQFKNDFT
jgi:hypothetical protein